MSMTPDSSDDPVRMLAYYDSRGVTDDKIQRIFSCSAEDLAATRETAAYKEAAGSETYEQTSQATEIDDSWNLLEQTALASLRDVVTLTADPRVLLGIAREANKAGRRNGGTTPSTNAADIHVPQNGAGETRVVRLRARFVDVLQEPDGTRRIMERQLEIRESSQGDMNEQLSPQQVKGILKNNIGVDTNQMHVKRHQGPDMVDGSFVDFDKIAEM